jgi:hypothetical protein
MRVELTEPESVAEPRLWVEHQQVLALVLRPGPVEWGLRRSQKNGSYRIRKPERTATVLTLVREWRESVPAEAELKLCLICCT